MNRIALPWKIITNVYNNHVMTRLDLSGTFVASASEISRDIYIFRVFNYVYHKNFSTLNLAMEAADAKLVSMKYRLINGTDPVASMI